MLQIFRVTLRVTSHRVVISHDFSMYVSDSLSFFWTFERDSRFAFFALIFTGKLAVILIKLNRFYNLFP